MREIFIVVTYLIFIIGVTIFLNNKLNIKIRDLEIRENALKIQIENLESREKSFEARYAAGKKKFSERDAEISDYHRSVIAEREESLEVFKQAEIQVNLVNQKIRKLQTELDSARQKSKRLAKKTRNTV